MIRRDYIMFGTSSVFVWHGRKRHLIDVPDTPEHVALHRARVKEREPWWNWLDRAIRGTPSGGPLPRGVPIGDIYSTVEKRRRLDND